MNRVVVTGLGALTPIGNSVSEFWENAVNGTNGIDAITRFDTSESKVSLAAELKNFDATAFLDKAVIRKSDLFTQYALIATKEAMDDSGIKGTLDDTDISIYYGTGIGGFETFCESHKTLMEKGPKRVSPLSIPKMIFNIAAGNIAIAHGIHGSCLGISTACASGTTAVGEGFRAIRDGYTKAAICGGTEAAITPLATAGFVNCMALSLATDKNAASLPFDQRRSGFVMGEGAGTLVLEEYAHAKERGAKIYCEVVGYGTTCDAHHVTAPDPEAVASGKAIEIAKQGLSDISAECIYINAHGTGTKLNDETESKAIANVFGDSAEKLHISSTKSMTGHMLGAAGAVEAIATILALQNNTVPPTINLQEKDEACPLQYTPNEKVETPLEGGLSTSLGFGGHNACVAFRKL